MKNRILLAGNGINNISEDYTWEDLIHNLIGYIGAAGQIDTLNKPFPLLYEEIFVEAVKNRRLKEMDIKGFIANEIGKLKPNDLHRAILDSGIDQILTTNYDLTFESLLTTDPFELKNNGRVKENTFSLFRHYQFENKQIWHIHGDLNYPASITLGYEHYSGYLQQMRNYVVSGVSYANLKTPALIRRLKAGGKKSPYSWLDFFFTSDVYFVGLTLDFIEMHLWWLLTFRQRIHLTKRMNIRNRIVYFYPETLAGEIKNRLQLLNSCNVIPVSCAFDRNDRAYYYKEVLRKIKEDL